MVKWTSKLLDGLKDRRRKHAHGFSNLLARQNILKLDWYSAVGLKFFSPRIWNDKEPENWKWNWVEDFGDQYGAKKKTDVEQPLHGYYLQLSNLIDRLYQLDHADITEIYLTPP